MITNPIGKRAEKMNWQSSKKELEIASAYLGKDTHLLSSLEDLPLASPGTFFPYLTRQFNIIPFRV
jgi:hypothetical protein